MNGTGSVHEITSFLVGAGTGDADWRRKSDSSAPSDYRDAITDSAIRFPVLEMGDEGFEPPTPSV